MNRSEICERLKKKLTEKRYEHSMGVEYTAACLAMTYGADVMAARTAGLLHDCAKCIPTDEKLKRAKKYKLPINQSEYGNPDLLHGKLGAYYAKAKYGIEDGDILSAITWHTTGRPDMSLLDKIIFVADYIEPNRKMIFELPEIRKEAFTDIDICVKHILKNTLEYLDGKTIVIDEMTKKTYDFYRNRQSCREGRKNDTGINDSDGM